MTDLPGHSEKPHFACPVKCDNKNVLFSMLKTCAVYRVHTGKLEYDSRTFQGLLKDFLTVFKD